MREGSELARGAAGARGAMIEASAVGKIYYAAKDRSVEALSAIDLSINDGEFVSIVGPSGCGKSTFLSLVAGLIPATGGSLKVASKAVTEPSIDVGIVFQDALLLDWRTVLQNVMVPIEVMGLPREEYRKRALELLEMSGLAAFAQHYPWQLSGGMQRRVAICRALVFNPPILLLDEPFGALDAMTRDYMNVELMRIWQQSRKTVMLITHSIQEAVLLSDRVVVMSAAPGRILKMIDVDIPRPRALEVTASPRFGQIANEIRAFFSADMFLSGGKSA
ncbi:MAG TPA: ABC transporter ATP-binding protein [Gemmatimonadaceae bacterium]|jgi:NitT/TauT family transport system ATP-binding protein|nr:ABC transporter ATP-binding protein [Gemmatimonadaceae bacterium]